jgi:methyl-accepting chemotaxis protein
MKESADFIKIGNLSLTIPRLSNDEIGDASISFNVFLNKLSGIISNIKTSVKDTCNNVDMLQSAINNTNSSIEQIKQISDEVQIKITDQGYVITNVTATMEQITHTIENQDNKINEQSSNVLESSSAISEMIANIQSIAVNLKNSSGEFEILQNAINDGNSNVERLKETVFLLNKQSDGVIEANEIINNIASQTDLLAMNAAIEAAHAGEYGKGFTVVADEIRKLAEVSNQQSKLISENLKNLKDSIDQAVNISVKTANSFEIILKSVGIVNNFEKEIKNSIDEQSSGSTQILHALTDINQIMEEVHTGSKEMLKGGKAIIGETADLVDITKMVKSSSLDIIEKIKLVEQNSNQSLELFKLNKENTEKIDEQVGIFKVKDLTE